MRSITGQPYFRFRHSFAFESDLFGNYDAGVVEYSTDGGPWTDAGALFVDNGYNGPIDGNPSNVLFGRDGFVGVSWGYGSSRLDLGGLKGHTVRSGSGFVGRTGREVGVVRRQTCVLHLPVGSVDADAGRYGDFWTDSDADGYPDARPEPDEPVVHAGDRALTFPLIPSHAAAGGGARLAPVAPTASRPVR